MQGRAAICAGWVRGRAAIPSPVEAWKSEKTATSKDAKLSWLEKKDTPITAYMLRTMPEEEAGEGEEAEEAVEAEKEEE